MHENNALKTVGFVLVAVIATAAAWFSKPQPPKTNMGGLIGEKMFPTATPAEVTRMEIRQYDETNHKVVPFEVGRVDGVWCIPSHSNYPADENNHLAEAATALMGVRVLDVAFGAGDELTQMDAAGIRARHNDYGVVDPDPDPGKIKSTDKGVGMFVTLKNKSNESLASCIIGKPVPEQSDQHYIRFAGKDQVYTVALDTSKLSTHFEDWIERNLLKLSSMDLKQVGIKDYSIVAVGGEADLKFNSEMALDYVSTGDANWKLAKDLEFKGSAFAPRPLAADEEVDSTKLNDLKSALDDLKIVDVERKPAAVPPDLRFKQDMVAREIIVSLAERGFLPAKDTKKGPGYVQLFSSKGDVRLQLNDGACYVLRFGETTGDTSSKAKEAAKTKAPAGKDEKKDQAAPGMNRYLFVMAEFNPDALTKPKIEPLPEEPKPEVKKDEKKTDAKKPEDKKPDDKKDVAKAEPAKSAEKEPPKVDIKAERERVDKENKRKMEDYDSQVAAGKKHVDELNGRFAPWYYVISDDVFHKIHLSREQIIKKKAKDTKDKDGHDHADAPPVDPPKPGPLDELHKATEGGPSK